MWSRSVVLFIVLISFFSCQPKKKEFTVIDENISYKLLAFEDNEKTYQKGNMVRAAIKLVAATDTIYNLFEVIPFIPENTPFYHLITNLNEGDSVCFKVKAGFLKSNQLNVKLESDTLIIDGYLKIYEFLTLDKIHQFNTQNDAELLEQKVLNRFVKTIPNVRNKNGVYIHTIQKGQGISVEAGKNLILKYRANFINGIEFDNTYFENYFEYTYGTPNQVIEGLDVALLGMKNKEKAKIIIPSQLAFGEDGSSTGIVPPFTTVVYEIEIIDIK